MEDFSSSSILKDFFNIEKNIDFCLREKEEISKLYLKSSLKILLLEIEKFYLDIPNLGGFSCLLKNDKYNRSLFYAEDHSFFHRKKYKFDIKMHKDNQQEKEYEKEIKKLFFILEKTPSKLISSIENKFYHIKRKNRFEIYNSLLKEYEISKKDYFSLKNIENFSFTFKDMEIDKNTKLNSNIQKINRNIINLIVLNFLISFYTIESNDGIEVNYVFPENLKEKLIINIKNIKNKRLEEKLLYQLEILENISTDYLQNFITILNIFFKDSNEKNFNKVTEMIFEDSIDNKLNLYYLIKEISFVLKEKNKINNNINQNEQEKHIKKRL